MNDQRCTEASTVVDGRRVRKLLVLAHLWNGPRRNLTCNCGLPDTDPSF